MCETVLQTNATLESDGSSTLSHVQQSIDPTYGNLL